MLRRPIVHKPSSGSKPPDAPPDEHSSPSANASESAFYRFLQQALTLGAKRLRPSVLPQFIGFLVYAALAAFLATSLVLNRPRVIAAAVVMLMIVGVMAILLLLGIGKDIHPIVSNAILLLVVMALLAISAYAVVKLLGDNSPGDSLAALKEKCMGGSASACSELDTRVQLTCRYDAACIRRAQCWQDKSRALVLIKDVCDTQSPNYNPQLCVSRRLYSGEQAKANCDNF
jgi:hypothetical protein